MCMAAATSHYDSLSVPTIQQRSAGETYALKKLHNDFKRKLIATYASEANLLVDVACGRAGDLHKWRSARVKSVYGVDVSGRQIDEARKRAGEEAGPTKCEFSVTSPDLDALLEIAPGTADAVTLMFALNYFWETEEQARGLFAHVHRLLKPGGRFFGVYADGDKVTAVKPLITDVYELTPRWNADGHVYGAPYVLRIKDTVLDGPTPAPEYLVKPSALRKAAERAGFEPVESGFLPMPAWKLPTTDMQTISGINASFCFVKKA